MDTAAVCDVVGWLPPGPAALALLTVAILMRNAKVAHQRQVLAGWLVRAGVTRCLRPGDLISVPGVKYIL